MRAVFVFLLAGTIVQLSSSAWANNADTSAENRDRERPPLIYNAGNDSVQYADEDEDEVEENLDVFDIHSEVFEEKKPERNALYIGGRVTLVAGVGLLVGGAITGGLAFSIDADLKKNCDKWNCGPDYHDDVDRRQSVALATDILLPLGALVVAGGIVMIVFGNKEEKAKGKGGKALSLRPTVELGTAGATLKWRF